MELKRIYNLKNKQTPVFYYKAFGSHILYSVKIVKKYEEEMLDMYHLLVCTCNSKQVITAVKNIKLLEIFF